MGPTWFYILEDFGAERHQLLLREAEEWGVAHDLMATRPGVRVRLSEWLIALGYALKPQPEVEARCEGARAR